MLMCLGVSACCTDSHRNTLNALNEPLDIVMKDLTAEYDAIPRERRDALEQLAALNVWVSLRKDPDGPMECQGGRKITTETIERLELALPNSLAEVEEKAETWTYDAASSRLYINFGKRSPAEQTVEISTRRRIFAPHVRGLGYIIVEGFVLEHCGNQYPTNFWNTPVWAQAGALGLRGGHHWIVRNNVIRYANTVAIDIGAGGGDNEKEPTVGPSHAQAGHDNLIERNYVIDNGAAGIIGADSTRMTIRDNVTENHAIKEKDVQADRRTLIQNAKLSIRDIFDVTTELDLNPLPDSCSIGVEFQNSAVTANEIDGSGSYLSCRVSAKRKIYKVVFKVKTDALVGPDLFTRTVFPETGGPTPAGVV